MVSITGGAPESWGNPVWESNLNAGSFVPQIVSMTGRCFPICTATGFQTGQIKLPFDTDKRHLSDPNLIWPVWNPVAVQIGKHRPVMLTICGTNEPAFRLDPQTGLPHDSGDPLVMD